MRMTTIKKLQEAFLGRVCTVLTSAAAKNNFMDQQFSDFFTGLIESIDEDGIFSRHPMTGCKNYYPWPHVICILEEQVVTADDPKYQEILEEIKKAPPENQAAIIPVDPQAQHNNPFVDAEMMARMAAQAKQANEKMLRKQ